MRKSFTSKLYYLCLFLAALLWQLNAHADGHAHVVTDDIEFSCGQTEDNTAIRCSYRLVQPDLTNRISASLGETELPIREIRTYPFEDSTTSVLFLIDTSRLDNPDVLASMRDHITAYVQQALPHQSIGLASFDASLNIIQPMGSDPIDVVASIEDITETDQPTELYRNTLDALNLLTSSQADRKALFIFSTGSSDDQSVYHSDIIKAANKANIKINTIGYPVDSSDSSSLSNLKSLAKETAGLYVEASTDGYELPELILLDPYAVIENGGVLTIDLGPTLATNLQGLQIAMLVFETTSKRITVKLPLELSTSDEFAQAEFKKADLASSQSLSPTLSEEETQNDGEIANSSTSTNGLAEIRSLLDNFWLIIPVAILFFAGALLVYLLVKRDKKPEQTTAKEEDKGPLGYLVGLADEDVQYTILSSPWKIGRMRQNDLFLEHSSVSREHAEFKRNRDGSYTITDLDSLNGVYLNNTKISTGLVMDGDQIDIGDIRLRFVTQLD